MGHTTRSGKLSGGRASIISGGGYQPNHTGIRQGTDRSSWTLVERGRMRKIDLVMPNPVPVGYGTGTMVKIIPWWQSVGGYGITAPGSAQRV